MRVSDVLGKHWRASDGYHIDVSALGPPEPMVAILQLLEQPGMEGPVWVHHNREPIHLYPELVDRGWNYEIISKSESEICLKLMRQQ